MDASGYLAAVCDHAAWAAARLDCGVELLHVEEGGRPQRTRCVQPAHRAALPEVLHDGAARLSDQGADAPALCVAHGELEAVVARLSLSAMLVVIGRRGCDSAGPRQGGRHVAAIVRKSRAPVLVAARLFLPVTEARVMDPPHPDTAYGDAVATSPLLDGLSVRRASGAALEAAAGPVGEGAHRRAALGASEDLVVLPRAAFGDEGSPAGFECVGQALLRSPRALLVC